MGKLQQHPVGSHNLSDYQKSPGIDLLISGRLGPIPGDSWPIREGWQPYRWSLPKNWTFFIH